MLSSYLTLIVDLYSLGSGQSNLSEKTIGDGPYSPQGNDVADKEGWGSMWRAKEGMVQPCSQCGRVRQGMTTCQAASIAGNWLLCEITDTDVCTA